MVGLFWYTVEEEIQKLREMVMLKNINYMGPSHPCRRVQIPDHDWSTPFSLEVFP